MLRLTLRNLNAFKVRLALTTFAVVLGVSFVVSSFVLTDGFRQSFSTLSSDIVSDVDFEVRPTSEFGEPVPFDDQSVDVVGGVAGVEHVAGLTTSESLLPIAPSGEIITSEGPPILSSSWIDEPVLSQFALRDGDRPQGDQFTMEQAAAEEHGFVVGADYELSTPTGLRTLTMVGTTSFGDDSPTMGALLMQFPLDTLQTLVGRPGAIDSVLVQLDDTATMQSVRSGLEQAMPVGVEIRDNAELVADTQADFDEGIDVLNNVMLGFAVVALFVSIFIIANTFAIVVGQRTAQLALLRAIGATPSQVRRSTMAEAVIIGMTASLIGLVAGLGITAGLQALFDALGADLPDAPLIMRTRTVVVAMVLGVGVTVLSAMGPARRASNIAPMQAMQASVEAPAQAGRRRSVVGLVTFVVGVAVGSFGLFANAGSVSNIIMLLGAGAILVFGAMTLMAPALVRPIVTVLGLPLRTLGAAGRLSTQNAGRNPRRTASTAASLTVGLGLVTTALVVGQSVKASIFGLMDDSMHADVLIESETTLSAQTVDSLVASGTFDVLAAFHYDEVKIDGEVEQVIGTDLLAATALFDSEVNEGQIDGEPNTLLVYRGTADERGISVGDTIETTFPLGVTEALTVGAIFDSQSMFDHDFVIADNDWNTRFATDQYQWATATLAPGVDSTASVEAPGLTFSDRAELREGVESDIDQALVMINVLLALAIIIALLGIANTAALSVFERTREVGLLRAVGMSRRQTRQMFRWESAQVSILGAVLGIVIGLVFGWGVVEALPDFLSASVSIPFTRIAVLLAVCGICGIVAAALPARRAARLNVIDALAMS